MFDWYRPIGVPSCPVCGAALDGWQGKQGPSALVVWEQGVARPSDNWVDDPEWREALRHRWIDASLPPEFEIHTLDDNDHWVSAKCVATEGVWRETKIVEVRELGGRRALWRAAP